MPEELLTLQEACEFFRCTRWTLYSWMKPGSEPRLRGFKVRGRWRFRQSDLEKFAFGTPQKPERDAKARQVLQAVFS